MPPFATSLGSMGKPAPSLPHQDRRQRDERRYRPRLPFASPMIFTIDSQVGEGMVLNLTVPGCLLESSAALKKGLYLQLKMILPDQTPPVIIALGVVRWENGTLFGVEFIKMSRNDGQRLNHLFQRLNGISGDWTGGR